MERFDVFTSQLWRSTQASINRDLIENAPADGSRERVNAQTTTLYQCLAGAFWEVTITHPAIGVAYSTRLHVLAAWWFAEAYLDRFGEFPLGIFRFTPPS